MCVLGKDEGSQEPKPACPKESAEAYATKAEATSRAIKEMSPHIIDIMSAFNDKRRMDTTATIKKSWFHYGLVYFVLVSFFAISFFLLITGDTLNGLLVISHIGGVVAGFIGGFGFNFRR